jgi:hypothetical protein
VAGAVGSIGLGDGANLGAIGDHADDAALYLRFVEAA